MASEDGLRESTEIAETTDYCPRCFCFEESENLAKLSSEVLSDLSLQINGSCAPSNITVIQSYRV